jgi:hypothetical protein
MQNSTRPVLHYSERRKLLKKREIDTGNNNSTIILYLLCFSVCLLVQTTNWHRFFQNSLSLLGGYLALFALLHDSSPPAGFGVGCGGVGTGRRTANGVGVVAVESNPPRVSRVAGSPPVERVGNRDRIEPAERVRAPLASPNDGGWRETRKTARTRLMNAPSV